MRSPLYATLACSVLDQYEAVNVTVVETGCYTFNVRHSTAIHSSIDRDAFDPDSPASNMIVKSRRANGPDQFNVGVYLLSSRTYICVIARHRSNETESYLIAVSGPNDATFKHISK